MVQNGFHRLSRDTRGFTMIELLLVVAILGVLSTIAIRAMTDERRRSYDAQTITFTRNLLTAVETQLPDPLHLGTTYVDQQPLPDYPQLQLNPGAQLTIDRDGAGRYQFFVAHQAGRAGFYFWVPGPDCAVETDDVTVQKFDLSGTISVPSDKIVPELATIGDIYYLDFRTKAGFH